MIGILEKPAPAPARGWLALATIALVALLGCASSRVPLTQELRTRHQLTQADMLNLQYYNSHTITLRREIATADKQINAGHKLVVKSGRLIEEVEIEAGTPGVAVDVGRDFIVVSFEQGTSLTFALRGATMQPQSGDAGVLDPGGPNPFPGNEATHTPSPVYDSSDLGGMFWLHAESPGDRVWFAGKWFDAVEDSLRAFLLIDADSVEEEEHEHKKLRGVRL